MDIDATGTLYVLLRHGSCAADVVRSYFPVSSFTFNPDVGGEIELESNGLDDFFSQNACPGMGRLPKGFIYVLEDEAVVLGFDGDKIDAAIIDRASRDSRFEGLLPWGDQPPPSSRGEFKSLL